MKEKYKYLYKFNNDFIKSIEENTQKPIYKLTPEEAREVISNIQKKDNYSIPALVENISFSSNSSEYTEVRLVRPEQSEDKKLPIIVYAHGGGWILGDENTYDGLIRKLAVNTNSCIAFVKYNRSPEAAFPVALNQVYAAVEHFYDNAEKYNIDSSKIILAGDSAGANLALSTALKLKNENKIKILLQILLYPAIDYDMDTKSYSKFEDGPWLSKKAMEWFWNSYIQDKKHFENFYAVPSSSDKTELNGLPFTLIITAENDPLRDEGEAFARKLDSAGVKVSAIRMLGTMHDFMMFNALNDDVQTKMAFNIVYSTIKCTLEQ